jgi:tetratricopeptide (TPR) repeat protein
MFRNERRINFCRSSAKKIDKPADLKIRIFLVNPFEKGPAETYRTYQKFRKRDEFDKAYRCLENLVKQFPDDLELLDEIVALALGQMHDPDRARPWLMRRIKLVSYWRDYALLSEIEAASGNLTKARENLTLATKLQKRQRTLADTRREIREASIALAILFAFKNTIEGRAGFISRQSRATSR